MSFETDVPLITGCYSTTTTAGDYQFGNALEGCQHPDSACVHARVYQYHARRKTGGAGVYESGYCTVNTAGGGTAARTRILKSSNAGAAVDWTGVEIVFTIVLSGQTLARAIRAFPDKPLNEAYLIYSIGQSELLSIEPPQGGDPVLVSYSNVKEWTLLGASADTVANHEWAEADPARAVRTDPDSLPLVGMYCGGRGNMTLELAQAIHLSTGADVGFLSHAWSGGSITLLQLGGTWSNSLEAHIAQAQSEKPANFPAKPDVVTLSQGWADLALSRDWALRVVQLYNEAIDPTIRGWADPTKTQWLLIDQPKQGLAGAGKWYGTAAAARYLPENVHYMSSDSIGRIDAVHSTNAGLTQLGALAFKSLFEMNGSESPFTGWQNYRAASSLKTTFLIQEATANGNPTTSTPGRWKIQATGGAIRIWPYVNNFEWQDWVNVPIGAYWQVKEIASPTKVTVYKITSRPALVAGTDYTGPIWEFSNTVDFTGAGGTPTVGAPIQCMLVGKFGTGVYVEKSVYVGMLSIYSGTVPPGVRPKLYCQEQLGLAGYVDEDPYFVGDAVAWDRETGLTGALRGTVERAVTMNAAGDLRAGDNTVLPPNQIAWRTQNYALKTTTAALTVLEILDIPSAGIAPASDIYFEYRVTIIGYRGSQASGARDMYRKVVTGMFGRTAALADFAPAPVAIAEEAVAATAAGVTSVVTADATNHQIKIEVQGPTTVANWIWNVAFSYRRVFVTAAVTI